MRSRDAMYRVRRDKKDVTNIRMSKIPNDETTNPKTTK